MKGRILTNLTVNTLLVSVSVFVFAKTYLNIPLLSIRKQNILMFLSKTAYSVEIERLGRRN